jgi:hypothetical protein
MRAASEDTKEKIDRALAARERGTKMQLVKYETARRALAAARRVDESI